MIKNLLFIFLLLILCACKNGYVVRNYPYAPAPGCDCYKYSSVIALGGYTFFRYNERARCNKVNRTQMIDSLYLLQDKSLALEELTVDLDMIPDSLHRQIAANDSMIRIYSGWIECKVRTRYRERIYGRDSSSVTIKRKIVFYNSALFFPWKKRLGKVKYINDIIVKSSSKFKV